MYKTEHFTLEELAAPKMIMSIGADNVWRRLDEGCLRDLDIIRKEWGGVIYINGVFGGKIFDSRGLRTPDDPDGAFWSVHKQGKAFDLVPKDGDVNNLYAMIYSLMLAGKLTSFNTLEDPKYTKSWVHIAKMNTDKNPLIIKP